MDSYNPSSGFGFPSSDADEESELSGILEIYVHNARNIHNICIYDNQDVYAKFSLTYNPDETISTRIVAGGGRNPDFEETLRMKINQVDAVLKCEIWMLSRARNYMEDQLLGFALVPISEVIGKGKVTQEYSLSSTDLFHSPAGTVRLTLLLHPHHPSARSFPKSAAATSSSISSEVVLLDRRISEVMLDQAEYSRVEFPDVDAARENHRMVSEYLGAAAAHPGSGGLLTFLRLGASHDDCDMTANSSDEIHGGTVSPNDSIQNSTTTSLSDERNSADSADKKARLAAEPSTARNPAPETPTSKKDAAEPGDDPVSNREPPPAMYGQPFGNINLNAEQSAMQQQIVDMYMKSMQQFSESLAKMNLPMDLVKPAAEDRGDVIQTHNNTTTNKEDTEKKKDGSRVFYGSRAFF